MPRLEAKDATYPTMRHDFKWAKILEINYENDTCDIVIVDKNKVETSETYKNAPIFYHCFPNVEKRDYGALEGASSAFARDDFVLVRFEDSKPIVVARLDGLIPCLDVILWGDKAYGIPSLNKIWNTAICFRHSCSEALPFAYLFSNTFKFGDHFITIILSFTIEIQKAYSWTIGADHYVKKINRKLSILTENGFILHNSSDGYWLDYQHNHIYVIKRRSYFISLLKYSSDGKFISEDKTIDARNYKLGTYNVTLHYYRLLCDRYGNIYAYCPKALGYYPKHYYRTTWQNFPEDWEEIEIEDNDYLKIFEQDIYRHDIIIDREPKTVITPLCRQYQCNCEELEEPGIIVPCAWTGINCEYPFLGHFHEITGGAIQIPYDQYLMCLDDHTAEFKTLYYGSNCGSPYEEPTRIVVEGSHWTLGWSFCADMEKGVWLFYTDGYCHPSPPIIVEDERIGNKAADAQFVLKIPHLSNNIFAVTEYAKYYDAYNCDFFMLVKTPEYNINMEIDLNNPYAWFEEVSKKGTFYICHSELEDKNGDKWIFDSKYNDKERSYFEYTLKKNGQKIDIEIKSDYQYWILTLYRLIQVLK